MMFNENIRNEWKKTHRKIKEVTNKIAPISLTNCHHVLNLVSNEFYEISLLLVGY